MTVEGTGAPYPGATVEFRNVLNGELHTTTDSTGAYSLQLPPDTYNAFALSLTDLNAGFAVAGTGDKSQVVTVPPSTELDFVAFPIN